VLARRDGEVGHEAWTDWKTCCWVLWLGLGSLNRLTFGAPQRSRGRT